ncbi:hypothetical protein Goshw_020188 [Gossypium schwendimanii]|uniref:Uncharacterized protein n=1 Tax=Gossypium schwendimanii TaxID=34291 RepID=A0A7J9MUV8_GOSSC|nr:hypothetical protein [Gossypium schwendimanii]
MLSKMVPVPCIKVADLGCASGPNTFFPACGIVDIVTRICQEAHCESPQLQVFLNDLPKKYSNSVQTCSFIQWEALFHSRSSRFFLSEAFPDQQHALRTFFLLASLALKGWQIYTHKSTPFRVDNFEIHLMVPGRVENKRNVYIAKSSPPNVSKAYFEQFRDDFSRVLRFRSEEMITGGRILLLTSLVGALLIPQAKTVVLYGVYSQNRSST